MDRPEILWSRTVKREARGAEGCDLGEVQAVEPHYVVTRRGVLNKETFYLPRDLADGFDGGTLWFRVSKRQAEEEFREATPPRLQEQRIYTRIDA